MDSLTPEQATRLFELACIVADEVAGLPTTPAEQAAALEAIREIVQPSPHLTTELRKANQELGEQALRLTAERDEARAEVEHLRRQRFVEEAGEDVMNEIVLCEGKYRFYFDGQGILCCDRYGEPWRDFIGDNAVLALMRQALEWRDKQAEGDGEPP